MIEVIKHGTNSEKSKSKKLVTRCNECGCVFSFLDLDAYYGGDLLHSRPFCEDYVCCPDCKNQIVVHSTSCHSNPKDILCEIVEPENQEEQ